MKTDESINERGFTLIELLVVVSIVGLLGSIAIASYQEYRDRAYSAAAQTLIHTAKIDLETYNLQEDAIRTATATRSWTPGNSSAYENANAAIMLPTVRVNEGFLVLGGLNSHLCGLNRENQFYVHAIPFYGRVRNEFQKNCTGSQTNLEAAKNPGEFWSS